MKNSSLFERIALFVLVAVAGSELLLRGVMRITARGGDLASPYVSTQRFIHGRNPYSSDDFMVDWRAAGAPANKGLDGSAIHPIYPPTALVVVAPLALLSWPVALQLYGWGCTGAYVVLAWLLGRVVGDSWTSARRLGFMAFALGLSPIHAGISQGNLSVVVFLLSGYGLLLAWRRQEIVAGICLALGLAIKPTGAIAAIAVVLFYGRIKAFLTSVGLLAAVAMCSAVVFSQINSIWRTDYVNNVALLFGPTGAASFTVPGNFDLVNLQLSIYVICGNAKIANALAAAVAAGLAAVWVFQFYRVRKMGEDWNWLGASSLLLIALLPIYQRNYNAEPIIFAAMWAFAHLHLRDAWARVAFVVSLVFLVPGEAFLRTIELPARLTSNILWQSLVLCQLTWAVVASIVLIFYFSSKPTKLIDARSRNA